MINLVFSGFSFILHLAHHSANASGSLCNLFAARDAFAVSPWASVIYKLGLRIWVVFWIGHVIDVGGELIGLWLVVRGGGGGGVCRV